MTPSSNVPWGKVTVTAEAMEKASELAANLRKASEMAGRYKTECDWSRGELERRRALYSDLLDDYEVLLEALKHIADNGSGGDDRPWPEFAAEVLASLGAES